MTLRAFVLEQCKGRPAAVRDAAVEVAAALDDGGSLRHALAQADVAGKPLVANLETNRERSMRTEFLHCVSLVLCKLVTHVDVVTEDVCRAPDREFMGLRVDRLAESLDLCQRRVERALWTLKRVGMLRSWGRAERLHDGSVRGHTAVRKVSVESILYLIGKGAVTRWKEAQRDEYRRRADKAKQPTREQQARAELRRIADEHANGRRTAPVQRRSVEGFTSGAGLVDLLIPRAGPPRLA